MGGIGEIASSRRSTMEGKHDLKGLGLLEKKPP
jgi:hypothetical protein